jgi:predicted site-specific integrase-resolvase
MPSEDPAIEDLVKIGAAATALGVSVDTLRRWERAGRVAFERRGSQRFISAHELKPGDQAVAVVKSTTVIVETR